MRHCHQWQSDSGVHILFLTDNFPPERNAPASRVYEHACYWARWGHRVTVLTCAPNFPEGKVYAGYYNRWYQVEEVDSIHVVRVKTFIAKNEGVLLRILDYLSFMAIGFLAGLLQARPDVVVATSPQFFTVVAGWAVAAIRRLPFVFELRDLWPASIHAVGALRASTALRWLERLELFFYRRAAKVVALTEAFKHDLVSRGIPAEHVAVVLNGFDFARYTPQPRDMSLTQQLGLEGCFVVGYIGTHGMAHALDRVLDAAALLRDTPAIRFLFVGAGALRDALIAQAAQQHLDNVIFVPAQPKTCMPAYWSICDLALVPLKNTPLFTTVLPSKIFEAMGMGRALVLAAPEGEASQIIRATGAGVIVPPECPTAMARAIRELYHDKALVERSAMHALRAAPQFSREQQARDLIHIFEQVVGISPSSRPR
jgi:putative colanic acid biosynthesis glycosyltransferase WcaI